MKNKAVALIVVLIGLIALVPSVYADISDEPLDAPNNFFSKIFSGYWFSGSTQDQQCRTQYECSQKSDGTYKYDCYWGISDNRCLCYSTSNPCKDCKANKPSSCGTTTTTTSGGTTGTTSGTTTTTSTSTTSSYPKIILNGDIKTTPAPLTPTTTDTITVSIPLKNTGGDMTIPWIIELQPQPPGSTGLQAIIGQKSVCDSSYPQNVHKSFLFKAGESATITLQSKISFRPDIEPNEYEVFNINLLIISGCCNSPNGCNSVDAPFGSAELVAQVFLIKPKAAQTIKCGDGRCDNSLGFETALICPADCGTGWCGDSVCAGSETESNCASDCQPTKPPTIPEPVAKCEDGYKFFVTEGTKGECCPDEFILKKKQETCIFPACDPNKNYICAPVNPSTDSVKSTSLELEDWLDTSPGQRFRTLCETKDDCEEYVGDDEDEEFVVKCVASSKVQNKLSGDVEKICAAEKPSTGFLAIGGGAVGAPAGCAAGAALGALAAGAGAIPGCIIGAIALGAFGVSTGVEISNTMFINCQTGKLPSDKGACIAVPKGGAGTFGWLTEEHDIFGVSIPTWGIALGIIILLMILPTLPTLLGGGK